MQKVLFDYKTATPEIIKAINNYSNVLRKESFPDDPARSLQATKNDLKGYELLERFAFERWHIWQEKEIVANLITQVEFSESNQHLMRTIVNVHPKFRNQGLASSLLAHALITAQTYNRRLMIMTTSSRVPAGKQFVEKLGAEAGLATHTNQLDLKEVDKSMMQTWIKTGEENKGYRLELFTNPLPNEHIDELITMMQVMNTAPTENLDVEDQKLSKEQIREFETYLDAHHAQQWFLCARHPSGELAGYTDVIWDPEEPHIVFQADTGVLPKYRGLGLGKWLKASMAEKILNERSEAKFIRTGNADSNAPMLAINQKMGFKPYRSEMTWQLDREKLKAYLEQKALL